MGSVKCSSFGFLGIAHKFWTASFYPVSLSLILFHPSWKKRRLKRKTPWNLMFTVVAYKPIKFAGRLRLQLAMVKWRKQTSKTQHRAPSWCMAIMWKQVMAEMQDCVSWKVTFKVSLQHAERGRKGSVQWGSGGEALKVWMTFLCVSSWGKDIGVD